MRSISAIAVLIILAIPFTASTQEKPSPGGGARLEPLPRALEVELAMSALPQHLRNNATVYVLNPLKGFEVARKGTNGFHTFVARTGKDAMRGTWPFTAYRDDILYPVSFDAAGAKAHMRVFFDIAEMQAEGTPPQEAKRIVKERYKNGTYKAPDRAGVSYMLAPVLRNYVNPDESERVETSNNPHIMYYAPNVTNADIGGTSQDMTPYPFIIMPGPHGFIIQHFGKEDMAAITAEYDGMLKKLCALKQVWCLPAPQTR